MEADQQYLSIRAPKSLVDRLDQLARDEAARTGLTVKRSAIVRRALEREVADVLPVGRKKGGK